jgi:phenylacetate-CoA ligase
MWIRPGMTDLYTSFASRVLFPLQERLKHHSTVADHAALDASQWWSVDALNALRIKRLRALLSSAGEQVPYYRKLFSDLAFDPSAVTSLGDLQRLPFLTKALIRAHSDDLRSTQAQGLARFNTGGSSGEPLVFFIGRERVSRDVAAKWRATRWWGVDIGDPEIVLWGSPIELGAQDRIKVLRDRLMRTRLLPAFDMSPSRVASFIDTIRRVRPRMLFGYPSAFALIARHARKAGIRLDDVGIKVAFVTSERLYPHQRELIESVFGCPVANGYGGRDAGFIAHQCPQGSMHITAEDVIVEIVDEDGNVVEAGVSGEIVVTHLATRDYPFIRYRTGDVGVLSETRCPCGRGLPVLADIQGRSTDFVVAADGTVMHGLSLIYVVRDLPGIESFRIEQESLALTRVFIVPGEAFSAEQCVPAIRQGMQARLGAGVQIQVEVVTSIAAERSGKYRYVVSRVTGANETLAPVPGAG